MADERIERLKALALFAHLSDERLAELTAFLKELKFRDGDIIFEEGSHGDSLFLVGAGQVRIEKKVSDGYKELARMSPGDFFGEMALIEETPRSARAVAQNDAVLYMLTRKELFDWLNSAPVMALGFFVELIRVLSKRLRRTSTELTILFDVSSLLLEQHKSEKDFLQKVLKKTVPHLDGLWSAAAFHNNTFNEEIDRVAVEGGGGPLPETLGLHDPDGWIGASTFKTPLSEDGKTLGWLVFANLEAMSPREKDEAAIALGTVAHVVSSALQNIAHRAEEEARARLEQQTKGSVQL